MWWFDNGFQWPLQSLLGWLKTRWIWCWDTRPRLGRRPINYRLDWKQRRSTKAQEDTHKVLHVCSPKCCAIHTMHQIAKQCTLSTDTATPGPSSSLDKAESTSSKRKAIYTRYRLWQKLEVLDYAKVHSGPDASRLFSVPRTPCWKVLGALPRKQT